MNTTLQLPLRRTRQHTRHAGHIDLNPDLVLQLYELLEGERDTIRLYSKALNGEVLFVNPERVNPDLLAHDCPVYTTRELAYVLSLSEEEFRRFHYLKTKLVG